MKRFYPLLAFSFSALVYLQVSSFGLINLDDYLYITDKTALYGWKWAFTWVGDAMWTPLTWLSFWMDWTLFGENWGAFHLHNVILHGINAALLYGVLKALRRETPAVWCLVAALVWSLHPLRVESVAWIASRKDMISTLFFLLSLLFWFGSSRKRFLVLSLLCVVVGGSAKASVMVFPLFVLVGDFLITKRSKPWWAYVLAVIVAVGFAGEAIWAQRAGGADYVSNGIPQWYQLWNSFAALTVYLKNLVLPTDLAVQCQLKYPTRPRFSALGFILLAGAACLVFNYARRVYRDRVFPHGGVVPGIIIFFGAILPFLGVSGFGSHAFADRFTILPSIGASLCFLVMVERASQTSAAVVKKVAFPLASVAFLIALACLTVRQVGFWENDQTLFSHTLEVDGNDNLLAHEELVQYYYEFPHDFERIYDHAMPMLRGAPWQQKKVAHIAPILIEAAYETGHGKEADEIYKWHMFWGRELVKELQRQNPTIGQMDTMQIVEAISIAYTHTNIARAWEIYQELKEVEPAKFMVKNLKVILARRGGNPAEIEKALREAYAPSGENLLKNRWALSSVDSCR